MAVSPIESKNFYGLNLLKRGMITGAEFVYMNTPFDIYHTLKRTIDRENEDETSVFSGLLKRFLKNKFDGITKKRDVLILEKLIEHKTEIIELVTVAVKYNRDAQGYFADLKNAVNDYRYWLDVLISAQIRLKEIMADNDWLLAESQKSYVVEYLHKLSECKANRAEFVA